MDDPAVTLREARVGARLTQKMLAERAGTSQAAISAYESGRKTPSLPTYTRLLEAAGARMEVLPAVHGVPRRILERNARKLMDVIDLAEAIGTEHPSELRYPRLPPSS